MMTSFMRMSQKLVFHQSNCICAIKRILSTTAMCVSSSSFMYLRFPCYSDACLNSSALRVGVTTLLNTKLLSVSAKIAGFIGLSRCWQNAVIFLTHPDNLRKKVQRTQSRVILQQR